MRLFIAEKTTLAKAIANVLGVTDHGDGFLRCGNDIVTWCFGHMFEQADPDEYIPDDVPKNANGKKIWREEDLPIIPEAWKLEPTKEKKKQLTVIGKLLRNADVDVVVNAGDADREGQLLIEEVLQHFKNRKPVKRYWASSYDDVTVKRGLDNLKNNEDYAGMSDAARARSEADWLVGMNLSRAYTLRAKRGGSSVLLTVGRVQTPTLALVVARDREIEAFKPVPYYTVRAQLKHAGGTFFASWKPKENQSGLDSEGRLIDLKTADAIAAAVNTAAGKISEYAQEAKTLHHPLAFSLSDITALASSKYGYAADKVLEICQALYEKFRLTSYPRTDCAYLPEAQFADAPAVLAAIRKTNPNLAVFVDGANTKFRSKTWNDAKVTAHHGIIPTMHEGNVAELNEEQRNVYNFIVRAYLAQFYPLHEYMQTSVAAEIAGEKFLTSGKTITCNGWRDVYAANDGDDNGDADDEEKNDERQTLPKMTKGDQIACVKASRIDKKTKAPPRFTDGTLVRAMENVHRFVSDPAHKKLLRDGDGIGTSATRPPIIADLKKRGFLSVKGKQLLSTPLGRSMIDALPDVVKSPVLTALYERMLNTIEKGAPASSFLDKEIAFVRDQVAKAGNGSITIAGGKKPEVSSVYKCTCGHGLIRRPGKKRGTHWWGCSDYPTCKKTYPDIKGKPDYSRERTSEKENKK